MKKTSLYMRKRRAQINQDGCLVKKHPMAVLRECRQFNDELGTGANAKDAMTMVFAAFDRMCSGVSTSTDDFDFLAHAVGVTEVRAVDIAGTDENPMLEVIAREVRTHPNPIRMEGHTDSVPIRTARFRSNWELSAARAIAMLELYSQQFGLDRSRMSIGGFGDTAPVASNDTQEGRNRNRRVDIVVLNEVAAAQDPKRPK